MSNDEMERVIMELVVTGGDARSKALEAIRLARKKEFNKAVDMLAECEKALARAHVIQTGMIQKEASGERVEVRLFMVHAQDHLMNAITVKDLATEMIEICKQI